MIERSKSFKVGIDFESVLRAISKQIYETPLAFIRENVQNAVDAIRIQAHREGASPDDGRYRIDITVDDKKVVVRDNGVGMSREDLENFFWTIGASGKRTQEAFAAGCVGVLGKNVTVAEAWKMKPFNLVVNRNRAAAHSDRVNHNVIAQKHFEHIPVAGVATIFAPVADDENHFAALSRPFGKIERSLKNGVVQYVRFLLGPRGDDRRIGIHWYVIDRRSLGSQRTIDNWRAVVSSACSG